MLVLIAILMVVAAAYLLYRGHVLDNKRILVTALVLNLGGFLVLYYAAGGKL